MLTSTVAAGSLATLHRAQLLSAQGNSDGSCIIKRLLRQHANDAELRALFLATGRAAMDVSTPDVARTLLVHEDPEPFIVMELVDGADLRELVETAWSAETARLALPILLDVLDGLQVLHGPPANASAGYGLVHGAPCARHIVVGKDGMGRLVDFTHAVGADLPWSPRRDERLIGSEMAPEQALAPAHVDPRCDLFIVGAVLWQVLTGRRLFEGDAQGALQSMLRQPILAPSEAGAAVARGLDRVCLRALQRARADRFASAAEMSAALREAMQKAGLGATREEIGSWVRSALARKQQAQRAQAAFGGAAGAASRSARPALGGQQAHSLLAPAEVARRVQTKSTLTIGTFAGPEEGAAPAVDVRISVDEAPTQVAAAALERAPSSVPEAIRSVHASAEKWLEPRPEALRAEAPRPAAPSERAPTWTTGQLVSVLDAPTEWKDRPSRRAAPRKPAKRRRTNGRAMTAGICIALGVPAIGLYLSSDLPRAGDAPDPQSEPALVELEPAAVQNAKGEAFLREASAREGGLREELGGQAAVRAPDATAAAAIPASVDGPREPPLRAARARAVSAPPAEPSTQHTTPSAQHLTPGAAEGLPHNPY